MESSFSEVWRVLCGECGEYCVESSPMSVWRVLCVECGEYGVDSVVSAVWIALCVLRAYHVFLSVETTLAIV